jgi:hypothetical protein
MMTGSLGAGAELLRITSRERDILATPEPNGPGEQRPDRVYLSLAGVEASELEALAARGFLEHSIGWPARTTLGAAAVLTFDYSEKEPGDPPAGL